MSDTEEREVTMVDVHIDNRSVGAIIALYEAEGGVLKLLASRTGHLSVMYMSVKTGSCIERGDILIGPGTWRYKTADDA